MGVHPSNILQMATMVIDFKELYIGFTFIGYNETYPLNLIHDVKESAF